MEDYKAYQAIAQIKQIVHDAGLCVANEIPCGSTLKRDFKPFGRIGIYSPGVL